MEIKELTIKDKRKWVLYVNPHGGKELGRIKSFNKEWVFVVFHCDNNWNNFTDYTGKATHPGRLEFVD